MNPYATLMLAQSLEADRERAAERRRVTHLEPSPREESRGSWSPILRFPRVSTSRG
jgi:hypothetical protein